MIIFSLKFKNLHFLFIRQKTKMVNLLLQLTILKLERILTIKWCLFLKNLTNFIKIHCSILKLILGLFLRGNSWKLMCVYIHCQLILDRDLLCFFCTSLGFNSTQVVIRKMVVEVTSKTKVNTGTMKPVFSAPNKVIKKCTCVKILK